MEGSEVETRDNDNVIGYNVARLRLDRGVTQDEVASRARISRLALGKIERGEVVPRAATLDALARALGTSTVELVTAIRPLALVRFRARKQVKGREQILAEVSRWLEDYCWLEDELQEREKFPLEELRAERTKPETLATRAREKLGLDTKEPVRDICGLLEETGVKVLRLDKASDAFFGLSVSEQDGGPAVVVNTWERISVERWIFTAAHELGHLLLHKSEYTRDESQEMADVEREADAFASHFLMPESTFASEWDETSGHPLFLRVLKVKRIFRVSYKTVLYRLVETERTSRDVWQIFQRQHLHYFGKTLSKADEPHALKASEFSWNWNRAGEPDGLSESDFLEDRLHRLVRMALERKLISLGRAAEILGIPREEMRKRAADWAA
jgi:Zn-dependent peptidase ImmA (M78 family)/DNA-binding XRE family transcriptional regulator